jgi:hypothetical protein
MRNSQVPALAQGTAARARSQEGTGEWRTSDGVSRLTGLDLFHAGTIPAPRCVTGIALLAELL